MFCWIYKPYLEADYEEDDLERASDPSWPDSMWRDRAGWFRVPFEREWGLVPPGGIDYIPRRTAMGR